MSTAQTLPLDPQALRSDFPILSTVVHGDQPLVYFDNAATTQRPRQVIQKLVDVYEHQYANVHRGIHWLSEQSTDLYEEARETVRHFINARQRHEVIFTTGATAAINLVARSWGDANVQRGRRDPADGDGAPLQHRPLAAVGRAHRLHVCDLFPLPTMAAVPGQL